MSQQQSVRRHGKREFESLMSFANDIALTEPQALVDFVQMLIRPLQSELMLDAATKGDTRDVLSVDDGNFFWEGQSSHFWQLPRTRRRRPDIVLRLNRDPVLPWPWERTRLHNALTSIGPGRTQGPWKLDEKNHSVTLWLPWGIAFVGGGNHSITAGIIAGVGKIPPTEVHDMSGIFSRVSCDGLDYVDRSNHRSIAQVLDPRLAAIFETGRLMKRFKVSAW